VLVLGANTGRYDQFRRLHRKNALALRLGVEWTENSSAFTVRAGKGRVAFLPYLQSPEGMPADLIKPERVEAHDYFYGLLAGEWRLPVNAGEMLQLLDWAAGGYRFDALVPSTVVVEFARQKKPARYLIHLVNFDLERDVGPFEIRCRFNADRAQAFTPDAVKLPKVLITRDKAGATVFRIPGFHRYLIVAVSK